LFDTELEKKSSASITANEKETLAVLEKESDKNLT
jgi:hypothetical protein